ncbi:hypothetical protein IFM89_021781 [Coptis chinensis]|uniref:GDSL esterase/lipase n=1 Tax=Coptis chinensis TaxID=261450 RepID=A0A835IRR4_9MAGN|nr:hypothetical protein IFM89_021781 [Coptis chinensis]
MDERLVLFSLVQLVVSLFIVVDAAVPAVFIFGDSTADVGTNCHLNFSGARADMSPNGIDYPGSKATGRFSNGYNSADFLSNLMGFRRSPPPFLSLLNENFRLSKHIKYGANFASGGAGLLDNAATLLKLYSLGARKFGVISVPPIGCCPGQKFYNYVFTGETGCLEGMNEQARLFYSTIQIMLQQLSSELIEMKYSLGNAYEMGHECMTEHSYFKELANGCCGLGKFNGASACTNTSNLCPNRDEYLCWDLFHPTQAAVKLAAKTLYDGESKFVSPINFKQLAEDDI